MDESRDNDNNERIYESIAECVKKSCSAPNNELAWAGSSRQGNSEMAAKPPAPCYGLALPSTATAKRAFKSGAAKLCGTVNSVCTKFGTLSQKLRRSTRRRAPLINSPSTPARKSRAELGRTPTKMYSPFSIETPRGKENSSARRSLNRENFLTVTPPRNPATRRVHMEDFIHLRTSPRLCKDMQDAQIGHFEFQHTADRILKSFRR